MSYPLISLVDVVYWGGLLVLILGINLSCIVKGTGVVAFLVALTFFCILIGCVFYYTPQVMHGTAPEWVFKLLKKG